MWHLQSNIRKALVTTMVCSGLMIFGVSSVFASIYDDFAPAKLDAEKWHVVSSELHVAPTWHETEPGLLGMQSSAGLEAAVISTVTVGEKATIEVGVKRFQTLDNGQFRFGFSDAKNGQLVWINIGRNQSVIVKDSYETTTQVTLVKAVAKVDEQPEFRFRIMRDGNNYTFFYAKAGATFAEIGKLTSDAVGPVANLYLRVSGDPNIAWVDYVAYE